MNSLFYTIRQAFLQIGRNKGTTGASFFAITAMMLILGLFFSVSVNVNLFTEMMKQDYDQVEIYLLDKATDKQVAALEKDIKKIEGVESVTFRSKDEALEIMKKRWGDSGHLLDSLGNNPLPNSLLVRVSTLESANAVNEYANSKTKAGVESTTYYKETVEKLERITKYLQIGIMIIMIFLVVVSIVVVSNTIRLTVFARSREISIMKYIGATNWFIRGPFLVEGILIGLLSSLLASVICYLIYSRVVSMIGMRVMLLLSSPLVDAQYLINSLAIIFMAIGIGVGAAGSIISIRRFLKV
jgi:cell division transport system permease protein